jgi:AcrR family transcriptional regulator
MRKGQQTRREIVDEALVLAGSVGLEGVSLGTLAERLKLSKSGLFAHFKSKEALQLEVLQAAIDAFVKEVVLPALTKARGVPRVRAMAEQYLAWVRGYPSHGSCIFMALTHEYDDRPGAVRDLLVQSQRDWYATIAKAARLAVEEGHFGAEVDPQQFAFAFVGIGMAFQQAHKLLEDSRAVARARRAFEDLIDRSSRRLARR